jgi:hypothetical protein
MGHTLPAVRQIVAGFSNHAARVDEEGQGYSLIDLGRAGEIV